MFTRALLQSRFALQAAAKQSARPAMFNKMLFPMARVPIAQFATKQDVVEEEALSDGEQIVDIEDYESSDYEVDETMEDGEIQEFSTSYELRSPGWNDDDKWTQLLRERTQRDIAPEERKPQVHLPNKKRHGFFKTGYNPNHLPHQGNYNKVRAKKPRLAAWDEPKFDWPPRLPRPTQHKGRALVNLLDREERERITANMPFKIPDFRTGDVIEAQMFGSLSEKNLQTYSGLVFYKKAPNSIRMKAKINFNVETVNAAFTIPLYSPLLQDFKIMKLGSNQLRKKLNYIPHLDINAGRLQEPITKGVGYKTRSAKVKRTQNKAAAGKRKLKMVNLESSYI